LGVHVRRMQSGNVSCNVTRGVQQLFEREVLALDVHDDGCCREAGASLGRYGSCRVVGPPALVGVSKASREQHRSVPRGFRPLRLELKVANPIRGGVVVFRVDLATFGGVGFINSSVFAVFKHPFMGLQGCNISLNK